MHRWWKEKCSCALLSAREAELASETTTTPNLEGTRSAAAGARGYELDRDEVEDKAAARDGERERASWVRGVGEAASRTARAVLTNWAVRCLAACSLRDRHARRSVDGRCGGDGGCGSGDDGCGRGGACLLIDGTGEGLLVMAWTGATSQPRKSISARRRWRFELREAAGKIIITLR